MGCLDFLVFPFSFTVSDRRRLFVGVRGVVMFALESLQRIVAGLGLRMGMGGGMMNLPS